MLLFRNPLIWLLRFRNRCGYGVHSPFAFNFLTDVVYQTEQFYAYQQLDLGLRWWQRYRYREYLHLLMRISNYQHPNIIICPQGVSARERQALQAGSVGAEITQRYTDEMGVIVYLQSPDDSLLNHLTRGSVIVVRDIHRHRRFWSTLITDARITVTFDLYDVGIAFCKPELNPINYTINW